jgi:hypothetical protein
LHHLGRSLLAFDVAPNALDRIRIDFAHTVAHIAETQRL